MDETVKKIDDLVNHFGLYLQTLNDGLKPLLEELENKLSTLNEADLVHIQKWPGRINQQEISTYTMLYFVRMHAIRAWGDLINGKQPVAISKKDNLAAAQALLSKLSKEELAKLLASTKKL